MKKCKTTKLRNVLSQRQNLVELQPAEKYKLLGMSLEGRGLFIREEKQGMEIGSKALNRLVEGDFIYSRLFAWKGAFDKVSSEFAGLFVSSEFPAFELKKDEIDIDYLTYYFNQSTVWNEVEQSCMGVTKASRNRFKEKFLYQMEIPLPPLPEQRRIVSRLKAVQEKIGEVKRLREEQGKLVRNLLFSTYQNVIAGAMWKEMGKVAPLVRREVQLVETDAYPELGVRSFGKGTFHKPALSGIEVGTKKIYAIEPGDLIFSNVFAWEGAIAVAGKNDGGRYGSHRFITCIMDANEALPEFLCFHFLTEKGMEDINAASPGGAGRNKTLGLKKLEKIKVPLPSIEKQREFIALKTKLEGFGEVRGKQLTALEGVMPGLLDKAFTNQSQ